ncbi:hypothetical protein DFH06DRAFT_1480952 [Mycena polygramma]|nr:hypothetical protein DFH06DRAFT_1480952 [Mycena polygramma]
MTCPVFSILLDRLLKDWPKRKEYGRDIISVYAIHLSQTVDKGELVLFKTPRLIPYIQLNLTTNQSTPHIPIILCIYFLFPLVFISLPFTPAPSECADSYCLPSDELALGYFGCLWVFGSMYLAVSNKLFKAGGVVESLGSWLTLQAMFVRYGVVDIALDFTTLFVAGISYRLLFLCVGYVHRLCHGVMPDESVPFFSLPPMDGGSGDGTAGAQAPASGSGNGGLAAEASTAGSVNGGARAGPSALEAGLLPPYTNAPVARDGAVPSETKPPA